MREIKFRFWDKEEAGQTQRINMSIPTTKIQTIVSFEDETTCIEQFTGLRDKNGRDIYEGDIVRISSIEMGVFNGLIEYEAPSYIVTSPTMLSSPVPSLAYRIEVIGTIHENPELIHKE